MKTFSFIAKLVFYGFLAIFLGFGLGVMLVYLLSSAFVVLRILGGAIFICLLLNSVLGCVICVLELVNKKNK